MSTIDLSTSPPRAAGTLDALPRRVALTLPELQLVAERAGGAPLPFEVHTSGEPGDAPLEGRLGESRGTTEERAYRRALAALHDPVTSLTRRGLISDGRLDEGLAGAVGLLATPRVAVDIDIAVEQVHAKAWHRQSGSAVASLATADGIVFELAWFPTSAWPAELSRVAVVPEDLRLRISSVPARLDLPYALADAAVEASGAGRSDLLHLLVAQHSGSVVDDHGSPCSDAEVGRILAALANESQGHVRALVADVSHARTTVIGVRSWVLLADGWRTLHPHDDGTRVLIERVEPGDFAADLAPVLSEVVT